MDGISLTTRASQDMRELDLAPRGLVLRVSHLGVRISAWLLRPPGSHAFGLQDLHQQPLGS